ncbi:MAG: hypothetical protein PVJ55_00590 [Anaerolineae bacterium]|jgi:hypothetical protein
MTKETKRFLLNSLAWAARALGVLVSGPFVYFLLFRSSQVVPNLSWRAPNQLPLLFAWIAVLTGVVLAWRWEMIGGTVTAVSAVLVVALGYLGCGADELLTCTVVAGPYLLTGLVLIGCCWGRERLRSSGQDGKLAA